MITFWRAKHFVLAALLALCCSLAPAWANACECPATVVMVCERPCGHCCESRPVPVQLGQQIPVTLRPVLQIMAAHLEATSNYVVPSRVAFAPATDVIIERASYEEAPEPPPRSRWGPTLACRAPPVWL